MSNELVIKTYPKILSWVAIGFILITLYSYFIDGPADFTGLVIGVFLPTLLFLSLEKKEARFNKENGVLTITSKYYWREYKNVIPLADITQIKSTNGRNGGFGLIQVITDGKPFAMTVPNSCKKKTLNKMLEDINSYLD